MISSLQVSTGPEHERFLCPTQFDEISLTIYSGLELLIEVSERHVQSW